MFRYGINIYKWVIYDRMNRRMKHRLGIRMYIHKEKKSRTLSDRLLKIINRKITTIN